MDDPKTVYEEGGRFLSRAKAIAIDGDDVVVLLGKKRKESVRVARAELVDIVLVMQRDEDYSVYYPSFKMADGSTKPVFREGTSARKKMQAKCDAIKQALGL